MRKYLICFDGSCLGNPGGLASYGWTLDRIKQEELIRIDQGRGVECVGAGATNNVAEWAGLQAALRGLVDLGRTDVFVRIRGDSLLVIEQLNMKWRCKKIHLKIYRDSCLAILNRICCCWEASWVPRTKNAECDALASLAVDEFRSTR